RYSGKEPHMIAPTQGGRRMDKLSQEQISAQLAEFAEWSQSGEALQRTFRFDNFRHAMEFVGRVADLAERLQHHPDIMIRYNKVTLTLSTHEAGGITSRDFAFVEAIDQMVGDSRPANS